MAKIHFILYDLFVVIDILQNSDSLNHSEKSASVPVRVLESSPDKLKLCVVEG